MIIIKKDKPPQKLKQQTKPGRGAWIRRYQYPLLCIALTIVIGIAFLAGVVIPETEFVKQLPDELGIGLQDRNLDALLQGAVSEPTLAFKAFLNAPELPTIRIDMKYKHFNKIEERRQEALQRGLLLSTDEDFVPAEIQYEGRTIKVKMRLKGDLPDHRDSDKWSYRIQVKGTNQLFEMRRFSIQHPKTRNFLSEKVWLDNLRLEGILAPRFQFINVVFNGTPKGIFALEESFSKELLESQRRREGVIIAFDENGYWQRWNQLGENPWFFDSIHSEGFGGFKNALINTSRSARVDSNPVLSRERETAIGLLRAFQEGTRTGSETFDAELLGRFLAISELWQTEHALLWTNIHFYYNPITAKLEPIGFDGDAQRYNNPRLQAFSMPWVIQALQDPIIAEAYIKELNRVSQPEYLEYIQTELGESIEQTQLSLLGEFPFIRAERLWEMVEERQIFNRNSLATTNKVLAFVSTADNNQGLEASNALQIEVRNIVALPVEITGFEVDGSFIPVDKAWEGAEDSVYIRDGQTSVILPRMQHGGNSPPAYTIFNIPIETNLAQVADDPPPEVKIETRILGLSTAHTSPARYYYQTTNLGMIDSMPTVQDALSQYPFLDQGDTEDVLRVRTGEWDVEGDLILPQGIRLQIGPGTTLRFAPDAILLATGPLEFRGTENAPVILAPQGSSWSGVVVLEAGKPSVWEHTVVQNTHGIERKGWILTGGITFYKSPIYLVRSHIQGSKAEDGINVILSAFEFRESEFSDVASDAFDGDFTEGVIYASNFHDVAGDAIDVSGSQIKVSEVVLQSIGDKALSIGENSQLEAMDIQAINIGIAVASKDLSQAQVERITIQDAIHAGLTAYTKKPEYGPANITASDVEFKNTTQKTLVQTESWIHLEDNKIEGSELDVKALYAAGILGN